MKQPKYTTKTRKIAGFSILEVVAVVAVLAIIAAIALPLANKTSRATKASKLTNEIASINRAIQIYTSNGGSLDGLTDPQLVLDQLKTSISETSAKRFVGLTGSMIDRRVTCEYGNADDDQLCAVYNPDTQQFELTEGAQNCVLAFNLNGAGGLSALEDREGGIVEYGEEGWIWDYEDAPVADNYANNDSDAFDPTVSPSGSDTTPSNNETFVETLGSTDTTNTPPVTNEPGIGTDGITSIQPCEAPQFVVPSGEFDKSEFPRACPIINPNGENGEIYYMIEGKDDEFKPYDSNFFCEAGDVVIAYCKATSEFYTDSEQVSCVYTTDNANPVCENDEVTVSIIYNTHLFANQDEGKYRTGDSDEGTSFGNDEDSIESSTTVDPTINDSDPDGDDIEVCDISEVTNNLPINATINNDGTITFEASNESGLLGYRRSKYFDQGDGYRGGVITSEVNESYNEFWADIASVYSWRLSEEGQNVGNRQDENGNFAATDTYNYTICDGFGGKDSGEIICRVQELTVLSPIAIDTDGSGAIELTNDVQSFDFTANGSKETVKGWFAGNDGILVDANYGDDINGEHLFGDMGGKYSDGFAKLSQRDEDQNGVIAGSEMANLKLWFDNGNAKLDDGELRSMDEFGINEISLDHTDYVSEATTKDGAKLHVEDIWFPVHK